ncbi:unnamed protein product [Prunus armeniaca]
MAVNFKSDPLDSNKAILFVHTRCSMKVPCGGFPCPALTALAKSNVCFQPLPWQKVDEIARMEKSITLESLVRFCDAVETLYTKDYLRRPTTRTSNGFYKKPKLEDFEE